MYLVLCLPIVLSLIHQTAVGSNGGGLIDFDDVSVFVVMGSGVAVEANS